MPSTVSPEAPSQLLAGIARLAAALLPKTADATNSTDSGEDRDDKICFSAQLCAASRALETSRPESSRLIADPYAAALAGPEALARVHKVYEERGEAQYRPRIAVRTRYFDDFATAALSAIGDGPAQLVSLAAGMDSRAFRLRGLTKAVSVFEVDNERVLKKKQDVLERMEPPPSVLAGSRTPVAADLAKPGWQMRLQLSGFDPHLQTVWLVEGLCYYLSRERVSALLKEIGELSSPGSRFCLSAVTKLRENRGGLAALFISDMPDPEVVVTKAGWRFDTADAVGGPKCNYGRWPDEEVTGEKRLQKTIYVSATMVEYGKPQSANI